MNALPLSLDEYYRPKSDLPVDENEANFDLPEVINDADLVRDIDHCAQDVQSNWIRTRTTGTSCSQKNHHRPCGMAGGRRVVCHGVPSDGRAD